MFRHILIPTDGSQLADKAVAAGLKFARAVGARVTAYHAIEELPAGLTDDGYAVTPETMRQFSRLTRERAQAYVDDVAARATKIGVRCHAVVDRASPPYDGIVKAAKRRRCDVIFMASHGRRGVTAFVMGSVTQKVLTHSTTPVLVYR